MSNEVLINQVAGDFNITLNSKQVAEIEKRMKGVSDEEYYYELKYLIANLYA